MSVSRERKGLNSMEGSKEENVGGLNLGGDSEKDNKDESQEATKANSAQDSGKNKHVKHHEASKQKQVV